MAHRLALIYIVLGTLVTGCAAASGWPEIQPFHRVFHFSDVNRAGVDITLNGVKGKPLYTLDCHSGSFDSPDFNYSGLLACRLASLYSKEQVSTLLTETLDQTSDWENRGRFLVKHLLPGCGNYPDWGRSRTFYLRGIKLVLSIEDESFESSQDGKKILKSYSLDVNVQRDSSAVTSIAKATNAAEPPWFYGDESCSKSN